MKLCTFIIDEKTRVGLIENETVYDITEKCGGSINSLITGGCDFSSEGSGSYPLDSVKFGNVSAPGKILCVGLNYKKHAEETGGEAPKQPVFFGKWNDNLCPHDHDVVLPDFHRCYDYEAELVIIIGKECFNIERENAGEYIFGYTCGNDLSARDCQFISNQWLSGKALPDFAPAGPVIVTADEFDPEKDNAIRCYLNGKVVQSDLTSGMIFSCRDIVYHASKYFRLEPGDLIYTGTPSGVILGHPKGHRVWMKPGDISEVEIEGIGRLTNRMI